MLRSENVSDDDVVEKAGDRVLRVARGRLGITVCGIIGNTGSVG